MAITPPVMNDDTSMLVHKMLQLSQERQSVIANNISNASTPNYIRRELDFEGKLADAVKGGDIDGVMDVRGSIVQDRDRPSRHDGNNISLPSEMNEMMQNSLLHQLLSRAYTTRLNILKSAITGK